MAAHWEHMDGAKQWRIPRTTDWELLIMLNLWKNAKAKRETPDP